MGPLHLSSVFICTYEQGLCENGDVKMDRNIVNFIQCDFCTLEFFFVGTASICHMTFLNKSGRKNPSWLLGLGLVGDG